MFKFEPDIYPCPLSVLSFLERFMPLLKTKEVRKRKKVLTTIKLNYKLYRIIYSFFCGKKLINMPSNLHEDLEICLNVLT